MLKMVVKAFVVEQTVECIRVFVITIASRQPENSIWQHFYNLLPFVSSLLLFFCSSCLCSCSSWEEFMLQYVCNGAPLSFPWNTNTFGLAACQQPKETEFASLH